MAPRVYLTREDAGRNMARYYLMDVQTTLFGEWSLVREWGASTAPDKYELWSSRPKPTPSRPWKPLKLPKFVRAITLKRHSIKMLQRYSIMV